MACMACTASAACEDGERTERGTRRVTWQGGPPRARTREAPMARPPPLGQARTAVCGERAVRGTRVAVRGWDAGQGRGPAGFFFLLPPLQCRRCAADAVPRLCGCCAGPKPARPPSCRGAREPPVPLRSRAPRGLVQLVASGNKSSAVSDTGVTPPSQPFRPGRRSPTHANTCSPPSRHAVRRLDGRREPRGLDRGLSARAAARRPHQLVAASHSHADDTPSYAPQ